MSRLLVASITLVMAVVPQTSTWRSAPALELMLPSSTDCWEPAIAIGPREQVYIVAGQRSGTPGSKEFDQRQVLWRSLDGGATFEGPWPLSTEGRLQGDQRIAVDRGGTIYVTYMDNPEPGAPNRLRLARSRDEGKTFSAETIPVTRVIDKPELAVSPDGARIAVVYESNPGPSIVTTADGGKIWNEARVVEPGNGRHFWPEALTFAPDGALWFAVPSMSDSDIAKRLQTEVQLHVYRSTDDGRSWQDSRISSSPRFLKGCAHDPECRVKLPRVSVAVDSAGQAYAAYTEGRGPGHPYALLLKSSADSGLTWSESRPVSRAPRPQSNDLADHDRSLVTAHGHGRVCVVWVDDRRGARDVFARCSTDGAKTWGDDVWLSNRVDGAAYKSPEGFPEFYGHYGGAAISSSGRLFAVWAEGERGYRTGNVWFNRVPLARN
ncbi:MAG TPA: sialidase family protein [Vicinamibacterales bacterium]|nr:sialidase family protein [Vicinamibacterales bacterium]